MIMLYEIVINGYINDSWFEEFNIIKQKNLTTIISGEFVDQAALFGVLRRINSLGIDLISVNSITDKYKVKD